VARALPHPWRRLFVGLSGFFELVFLTGNQALLQLSIPDELRGRVTSTTALFRRPGVIRGLTGGAGSEVISPQAITLLFSATAIVLALLVYLFGPVVRDYRMNQAIQHVRT
jgi:hypothetical protein